MLPRKFIFDRIIFVATGTFLLAVFAGSNAIADVRKTLQLSRDATVRVQSVNGNSSGSGFFIGDQYILTCFHVIASMERDDTPGKPVSIRWRIYPDIKVKISSSNEEISAAVISAPTDADPTPLVKDFAILKLAQKPTSKYSILEISTDAIPTLGDEVVFSGFPLATPGMVTHRGMVSGADEKNALIFIQASINKGNSGGALVNERGKAIGIVSMREGGISHGLSSLSVHINESAKHGNVQLMGVDPLQAVREIVGTLDQYISTGIGYAHSTIFAREYLERNPLR